MTCHYYQLLEENMLDQSCLRCLFCPSWQCLIPRLLSIPLLYLSLPTPDTYCMITSCFDHWCPLMCATIDCDVFQMTLLEGVECPKGRNPPSVFFRNASQQKPVAAHLIRFTALNCSWRWWASVVRPPRLKRNTSSNVWLSSERMLDLAVGI